MSEKVVMPIDTFNKVVDYIQKRPFVEVANIIEEIRNTTHLVQEEQVSEVAEEEISDE